MPVATSRDSGSSSTADGRPTEPGGGERGELARMEAIVKLAGKIAVVTGAGSSGPGVGTGKATSVLFAREGAAVVLVDKFEDRAKETLALVEAEGAEASIVTADLAEIDAGPR